MTTMREAKRLHRSENLVETHKRVDAGDGKSRRVLESRRKVSGYKPFRTWARENAERFESPSPKLARILGVGR